MKLAHKLMVTLCRQSWRGYGIANFSVEKDSLKIRIANHIGLSNLEYRNALFQSTIRTALTRSPQGYFVDIGANIGLFLLNLVEIDRSRPYIGFEPLIPAAAYVRQMIRENRLNQHTILSVALSDRHGATSIRFSGEYDVSATISEDTRPMSMYDSQQLVPTISGDSVLDRIPAIALVKLDVEGAEVKVLQGRENTIKKHRPPFLIEVMPYAYFLDGTYNRQYYGEMTGDDARRIGEKRRQHCVDLDRFFRGLDYRYYSFSENDQFTSVSSLDMGNAKVPDKDILLLHASEADEFVECARC